jgi:hypothetical protein
MRIDATNGLIALDPADQAQALACRVAFAESLAAGVSSEDPFPHWVLSATLPEAVLKKLTKLPLEPPPRAGPDQARTAYVGRHYFSPEFLAAFPVCSAIARTFQAPATARAIEDVTGADLGGCYLRIELALDVDGFQLEPHTDLGVKRFTLLTYVDAGGQRDLGTDLYRDGQTWAKQVAFAPGAALAFVPSDRTWHGFEPRMIRHVRRSLIVNYVTAAWRDRDQLAYPRDPVHGGLAAASPQG